VVTTAQVPWYRTATSVVAAENQTWVAEFHQRETNATVALVTRFIALAERGRTRRHECPADRARVVLAVYSIMPDFLQAISKLAARA
jgi:hypothetical protein